MRVYNLGSWLGIVVICILLITRTYGLESSELWEQYKKDPNRHPNIPNCSYSGYYYGEKSLPQPKIVVNVREMGAKGNGLTDDTHAFQLAILQAEKVGGGTVYIPEGTYKMLGMLRLSHSHIVLRGTQNGKSTLLFQRPLSKILGPLNFKSTSDLSYSFFGGLIFIAPFSIAEKMGSFPAYYEQGWPIEGVLAHVIQPAKRGDSVIRVDHPSRLRKDQRVVLGWKNISDHSLLEHIAGYSLMGWLKWDIEGRRLVKKKRFYWPVEVREVKGSEIVLKQPLRLNIRPEWDVIVMGLGNVLEEVGVENLIIKMTPTPAVPHFQEKGFNGIYFNKTFHSWLKNITLEDVDSGVLLQSSKNITVAGVTIRGKRSHHHAFYCSNSHDNLFTDFQVLSKPRHGLNNEGLSTGNVWRHGFMAHGTFDIHRMMPFDFIRTQIKIHNDGKSGGTEDGGPLQGARAVHWNIIASGESERIYQPDLFPMGALVGVRGIPISKKKAPYGPYGRLSGENGCIIIDDGKVPSPLDLYEAQLKLRMSQQP